MSIEKITRNAALTVAVIYASIILLFSFPAMQGRLANWIADVLSEQLATKVSVRSVSIGLLNRIIINDVSIIDRKGAQALSIARMSVAVKYLPLVAGKIDISTAQLYGAHATIYRQTPDSPTNIQFIIDALSSEDTTKSSSIDLRINSLVVRHAYIRYDVRSEQRHHQLDMNHVNIHDTGFNLSIKALREDSINVRLRRFSSKELNSGLTIQSLNISIEGNNENLWLRNLSLAMPHSTFEIDSLHLRHHEFDPARPFSIDSTYVRADLYAYDFAPLLPMLQSVNKNLRLSACLFGSEKEFNVIGLSADTDNGATNIHSDIKIDLQKDSADRIAPTAISLANLRLSSSHQSLASILNASNIDSASISPLLHMGDILLTSSIYARRVNDTAFNLNADAHINTSVGELALTADLSADKLLKINLHEIDIDLGALLNDKCIGHIGAGANATLQLGSKNTFPVGSLNADIDHIEYKGYRYTGLSASANSTGDNATIRLNADDPNANIKTDISVAKSGHAMAITSDMDVIRLSPHTLNLTEKFPNEDISFNLSCDLTGSNIDDMRGTFSIADLIVNTPDTTFTLSHLDITAKDNDVIMRGNGNEHSFITTYTIESDIMNAELNGTLQPSRLPVFITNTLSRNLSQIISSKDVDIKTQDCSFYATIFDSPLVCHLTGIDYSLPKPILLAGNMDSEGNTLKFNMAAPQVIYSGTDYRDIDIHCAASLDSIALRGTMNRVTEQDKAKAEVKACVIDNCINTDIDFVLDADHDIKLQTNATVQFDDSLGNLLTSINFRNSEVNIDSADWAVTESFITICNKEVECRNFRIQHGDSYIIIDGKASPNDQDQLIVNLSNIDVEYVLNLVNFHSVEFGGLASGNAIVGNIFGKPDLKAHLDVRGFKFEGGDFGNASIDAQWDKRTHGIEISAIFTDDFQVYDKADGKNTVNIIGLTNLIGYVSPEEEYLDLRLQTNRTNAEFLNGFLDGIFSNVNGYISGPVSVVGHFSEVDVIGEADVTLNATLLSTNVTYHMENQRLKMSKGLFDFQAMHLTDKNGKELIVNGYMKHEGFDNIDFDFNAEARNTLCYEEHGFNSDHFYGTIYGTGNVSISGIHNRPTFINANITTNENSVFAYDAWSPETAGNSSFITFRDKSVQKDSTSTEPDSELRSNSLSSDLYINCNLILNENCKVMVRLDNTPEEGYISVRGNSPLQIKYYNKGAFEMFGNYAIESGNYRLYLQNPIYKDLAIQSGSSASFNGNPFNAKVHLNCKHTINSVPLSDLTVSTGTGQRNDVRVECLLDITGNLSKLDLDFDLNLPTASDETRQLVNSMINTDEEMNRQIIYLLAIGRFYPNEYARASSTSNNSSSAAVSSFVSSTISGQINNMLGSLMGSNSNWNVGAGISAGERGWEDMGVEGSLSGRLFNERLLINGVFGYRDNARTNTASFIGDFEVKWRLKKDGGNMYLKAYNQTNDRYFTKSTINTQGIGLNYQHDFDDWRHMFRKPLLIKP